MPAEAARHRRTDVRLVLAVLVLAIALPAAGQTGEVGSGLKALEKQTHQAAEAHLQQGLAALERGAWQEVARHFRAAVEALSQPAWARAQKQFQRGLDFLVEGDRQAAENHLRAGLESLGTKPAPEDAEALFRDGLRARDSGQWDEAAEHFRRAAEIRSGDGSQVRKWEKTGKIVNTRGFAEPYLPRYFAGEALYNRGLDRCGDAIREWSLCEAAGAIQQQEAYYGELQKMKAECDLEM